MAKSIDSKKLGDLVPNAVAKAIADRAQGPLASVPPVIVGIAYATTPEKG